MAPGLMAYVRKWPCTAFLFGWLGLTTVEGNNVIQVRWDGRQMAIRKALGTSDTNTPNHCIIPAYTRHVTDERSQSFTCSVLEHCFEALQRHLCKPLPLPLALHRDSQHPVCPSPRPLALAGPGDSYKTWKAQTITEVWTNRKWNNQFWWANDSFCGTTRVRHLCQKHKATKRHL